MATISNTIKLQDKMTPILRRITSALNSTLDVLESTDTASSQAFKGVRRDVQGAINSINSLENEIEDLQQPISNARAGFSGWQAAITTANQGLQLVMSTARGVANVVGSVTGFADTQTGITSRLNLMTGSLEKTKELQDAIYQSAQRSRASYEATADSIAKMGMMAADAFKNIDGSLNTDELLAFTESINKQLVISGVAGTAGADAALFQLTQAMSSGVLRGEELNSVMEQAPMIADSIAKYMGISKGELRALAAEGQVTSQIVKEAMIASLGEVTGNFKQMPTTFGQAMTMIKNEFTVGLRPLVQQFSDFAQSDTFQQLYQMAVNTIPHIVNYVQQLIDKLSILANSSGAAELGRQFLILFGIVGSLLQIVVSLTTFIIDNWQWISPIIYGVAAAMLFLWATTNGVALAQKAAAAISALFAGAQTALSIGMGVLSGSTAAASAAVMTFNSALWASPITWIIAIIVALIAALFVVIGVINKVTGSSISALGIITGALTTAVAFIWNLFVGLLDLVLGVVNYMISPFITFANFLGNLFTDPIGAVVRLFGDMADSILGVIESIAKAMDSVFGTDMAKAVKGWRKGIDGMVKSVANTYGNGKYEEVLSKMNLSSESLGISRWAYGDAWDSGYNFGEQTEQSIGDMFAGFDMNSLSGSMADMAANTEGLLGLADGSNGALQTEGEVTITEEDIKLLKDVAKTEWTNKYTTLRPELTITFGDVHETADVNVIAAAVEEMVVNAYASGLAY